MPEVIRGVGCVLAVVGCVVLMPEVVHAQTTRLIMEASVDGAQTWGPLVEAQAGQVVYFRVRAQLIGATALGFCGVTYQPTLSNWHSGVDAVVPFTFPGLDNTGAPTTETAYDGRQVAAVPATNTGRMYRFGMGTQSATSSSGLLIAHADPGNVLRFAGSKNTTPTTSIAWGVASAQQPATFEGFDSGVDEVLFRYAVVLNSAPEVERIATIEHVSGGIVRWYLNTQGSSILNTPVEIVPARVVPGPGVASVAVVAGLFAVRRRRER